jgi:hypothetical protein
MIVDQHKYEDIQLIQLQKEKFKWLSLTIKDSVFKNFFSKNHRMSTFVYFCD